MSDKWISAKAIFEVIDQMCPACWCSDFSQKYLEVRIDTRDKHAVLFAAHDGKRRPISNEDILKTIAACKASNMHLPVTQDPTWFEVRLKTPPVGKRVLIHSRTQGMVEDEWQTWEEYDGNGGSYSCGGWSDHEDDFDRWRELPAGPVLS